MKPKEIRLPSPAGEIPLRVFQPEVVPRAGVIFYMDAFGWRDEIDAMCARYAEHGYACYLPDLYWRLGTLRFRPHRTRDEPLPAPLPYRHVARAAPPGEQRLHHGWPRPAHDAGMTGLAIAG